MTGGKEQQPAQNDRPQAASNTMCQAPGLKSRRGCLAVRAATVSQIERLVSADNNMYMKRDLAGPHAVVVIEIVEMKNGAIIFDVAIPNFRVWHKCLVFCNG